jgi:hypothetical protein
MFSGRMVYHGFISLYFLASSISNKESDLVGFDAMYRGERHFGGVISHSYYGRRISQARNQPKQMASNAAPK